MNEYVYVGKIVNTHALKGEVRLLSNFEYKDKVFLSGKTLYIGMHKSKEIIETYRRHKQFDMIKFKGIDYINDVLKYKGAYVYVLKNDIELNDDEILPEEFLLMNAYNNDKLIGKIEEYRNDNGNKMIKVSGKYIPYNKDFITKIDKKNNAIYFHGIEVFL